MRFYLILLLALLTTFQAVGQGEDEPKLTIPASPAFSILNFEPAAVLKPTTHKALATDVLSAFDKGGNLLPNFGLEVAPYWLQSRPTLTREQYLNPDRYPFQTIKQSFTFSVATTKDSASGSTRLGTGFRFRLLNGSPMDTLLVAQQELIDSAGLSNQIGAVRQAVRENAVKSRKECLSLLAAYLEVRRRKSNAFSKDQIERILSLAKDLSEKYTDTKEDLLRFLEELTNLQVSSYDKVAGKVAVLNYARKGWVVDVAGAAAFNTTNENDFNGGLWLNAGNFVSETDLISLTGRLLWTNSYIHKMNLDAGAAYCKQAGRYNFSFEAMLRWYVAEIPDLDRAGTQIRRVEKDFTYRLALQSAYLLTPDISVNLSIGKGFTDVGLSESAFFSIVGFNYSIFKKQYVAVE